MTMKLQDIYLSDIWDIKITDDMRKNVNYEDNLYWLSGGDREWKGIKSNYKVKWDIAKPLFMEKYISILEDINNNSENLGDVKNSFIKYFNLLDLYEFSLSVGIIK